MWQIINILFITLQVRLKLLQNANGLTWSFLLLNLPVFEEQMCCNYPDFKDRNFFFMSAMAAECV